MRNSIFLGMLVALTLLLTAALAYAIIDKDSGISGTTYDNSLVNTYNPGAELEIMTTGNLKMITNDKGSHARMDVAIYRPAVVDEGWYLIGDLAVPSYGTPTQQAMLVRAINKDGTNESDALAPPVDWVRMWAGHGYGGRPNMAFWMPVPPEGYVALGCVGAQGYSMPEIPEFRCVRADLCTEGKEKSIIWNDYGSGESDDVTLWSVTPDDARGVDALTFWAHKDYRAHPAQRVYCLNLTYVTA
ncbi:Vps62-related protein [Methanocella sp. MCL-LM]|uniref:Vps62-related protein n=1 Tax=Methanocella sp. MCL-LM TaxID=3412035 RepID=UPI003C7722E6